MIVLVSCSAEPTQNGSFPSTRNAPDFLWSIKSLQRGLIILCVEIEIEIINGFLTVVFDVGCSGARDAREHEEFSRTFVNTINVWVIRGNADGLLEILTGTNNNQRKFVSIKSTLTTYSNYTAIRSSINIWLLLKNLDFRVI